MIIHAPAKINLALLVGTTDESGLHPVDSLFHFLEFGDTVSIEPAGALSLTCSSDLGIAPEQNLAYRAAVAMGERFDFTPAYSIHIEKRIPHGAGLGGGSSDAAAVILAIATDRGLDPRSAEVLEVAASLGADVPVFLAPEGAPIMTGHGERLVRVVPAAVGLPVVVVKPHGVVAPTGEVYRTYDVMPFPPHSIDPTVAGLADLVASAPDEPVGGQWDRSAVYQFGRLTVNALQLAAMKIDPEIEHTKAFLTSQRECLGAMVSGSGAASFALCATDQSAADLAASAERRDLWAAATRLAGRGVHLV